MKTKRTSRGFPIGEFIDSYGAKCSIQDSSSGSERRIWLGTDDANPQVIVPGHSWQPVPFPEGTSFNTRMHLNQKQVKKLLPLLEKFVKTGSIH